MLERSKGIGPQTAAILWMEGLFRSSTTRRKLAAYAGLAPTPWQSGWIDHERDETKVSGQPADAANMVELAWVWLESPPGFGAQPVAP